MLERIADGLLIERGLMGLAFADTSAHATQPATAQSGQGSASRSRDRSRSIMANLRAANLDEGYLPPVEATTAFSRFLASDFRTFVIAGSAGCGKTSLVRYLAETEQGAVWQLQAADGENNDFDLATAILRYGSADPGPDPLLTLERLVTSLTEPHIVALDGITAEQTLAHVCQQVDSILRQVRSVNLRFVLAIRTPPTFDLSRFPILAASVFRENDVPGSSVVLGTWPLSTARATWEASRVGSSPRFDDLPASVQQLATVPLYMRLLRTSGAPRPAEANEFQLIDHCVDAILTNAGHQPEVAKSRLAKFAHAQSQSASSRPSARLRPSHAINEVQMALMVAPPLTAFVGDELTFGHDVIREYFLALSLCDQITDGGPATASVLQLNDLATRAESSASVRGAFLLTVCALDQRNPEILSFVAGSTLTNAESTLTLMLGLIDQTRFATQDVLRRASRRARHDTPNLVRALLATPFTAVALGDGHAKWFLEQLRSFGSSVWEDAAAHLHHLGFEAATRLLDEADLRVPAEATFIARYYYLFPKMGGANADVAEVLCAHSDWRVRAAMATALPTAITSGTADGESIATILATDHDYKVRAATAAGLASLPDDLARRLLPQFLIDDNWHVRRSALDSLMDQPQETPAAGLIPLTFDVIQSQTSWRSCPSDIETRVQRLRLLTPSTDHPPAHGAAADRAALMLLREFAASATTTPPHVHSSIQALAHSTQSWLLQQEVTRAQSNAMRANARRASGDGFRLLRDSRTLQVALDLPDLDRAAHIAEDLDRAGTRLIEVGDPLIKANGVRAVEELRRAAPGAVLVAEMMSADWGRDQVESAAAAGADAVLLIGPASMASVTAATRAARRLGVAIVLDIPAAHANESWVRSMERAGVDAFAITTNIDLGVGVDDPMAGARLVRSWTRLPVSVSGGFSASDDAIVASRSWDILIVGRSITEAVAPATAAAGMLEAIHRLEPVGGP
ncbi:orotidine 5'-phosphate decarboxylase / HUMPS family protein [Catellatospora chokoriensis]|uniref:orotidine 5'-phosphate decarboxylase / HUMPS family protein n=1 Tax=Catellatospora chokoriensis TaxID=310353 RepID=UPI00177B01C4|nr:orotidine 5'-phosphate decarboxylase / HUMPS family protein [Catellatospora chokoriensis]